MIDSGFYDNLPSEVVKFAEKNNYANVLIHPYCNRFNYKYKGGIVYLVSTKEDVNCYYFILVKKNRIRYATQKEKDEILSPDIFFEKELKKLHWDK